LHETGTPPANRQEVIDIWKIDNLTLFYQFVEKMPVPVFMLKGPNYSYVNPAMIDIIGYSWDELIYMNWWDPVPDDRRAEIKQRGFARMAGEPAPAFYELEIIRKDGTSFWTEHYFSNLYFDGIQYTVVVAYDITARKKAEDELQRIQQNLEVLVQRRTDDLQEANEELLRLNKNLNDIFENLSDGVIVLNEAGEVEILNQVLEQAWGPLVEEFKTSLQQIVREKTNPHIAAIIGREQPFREVEMMIPTTQGDIHCLASGTPIKGEKGKPNSTILFIRPIKEIRKLVNRFSGAWATFHFSDIISDSPEMDNALRAAYSAASSMSNVLIQGESGTGKELLAQAIHNHSERRNGPFVALNCGAIPRDLIGSELFGYAEGAFTGAKKGGNPGKFEMASGGTLFLDEIGDMPLDQQVTLLRVLQEKTLSRIAGTRVISVDVRVICATNKDLYQEMMDGNFRHDLYYRLNVINIQVPRLQERLDDIPLLFNHFLRKKTSNHGIAVPHVQPEVLQCLQEYSWPGNVRELENIVERLIYASSQGEIRSEHLPREIREQGNLTSHPAQMPVAYKPETPLPLSSRQRLDEIERDELLSLLRQHDGNVAKIARQIGVSRNTVYTRMKKYQLSRDHQG